VSLIRAKVCLARNIVFLSKTSWDSATLGGISFCFHLHPSQRFVERSQSLGFYLLVNTKGTFFWA
jgi:hypothetical protein